MDVNAVVGRVLATGPGFRNALRSIDDASLAVRRRCCSGAGFPGGNCFGSGGNHASRLNAIRLKHMAVFHGMPVLRLRPGSSSSSTQHLMAGFVGPVAVKRFRRAVDTQDTTVCVSEALRLPSGQSQEPASNSPSCDSMCPLPAAHMRLALRVARVVTGLA